MQKYRLGSVALLLLVGACGAESEPTGTAGLVSSEYCETLAVSECGLPESGCHLVFGQRVHREMYCLETDSHAIACRLQDQECPLSHPSGYYERGGEMWLFSGDCPGSNWRLYADLNDHVFAGLLDCVAPIGEEDCWASPPDTCGASGTECVVLGGAAYDPDSHCIHELTDFGCRSAAACGDLTGLLAEDPITGGVWHFPQSCAPQGWQSVEPTHPDYDSVSTVPSCVSGP